MNNYTENVQFDTDTNSIYRHDHDLLLFLSLPFFVFFIKDAFVICGYSLRCVVFQVKFLNDESKPLIIIDTPALDDSENEDDSGNKEKEKQYRLDLQSKLEAMQRIDLVLILINLRIPVMSSKRLIHDSLMIGDIVTVFGANTHLYGRFVIGFACCDEFNHIWKIGFGKISTQWQDLLQSKFDFGKSTDEDVSKTGKKEIAMFKLSSVQHSRRFDKKGIRRWSQYKEFNKLFEYCVQPKINPLYTSDYILIQEIENLNKNSTLKGW